MTIECVTQVFGPVTLLCIQEISNSRFLHKFVCIKVHDWWCMNCQTSQCDQTVVVCKMHCTHLGKSVLYDQPTHICCESVDCRPSNGRHITNTLPTVHRLLADSRSTCYGWSYSTLLPTFVIILLWLSRPFARYLIDFHWEVCSLVDGQLHIVFISVGCFSLTGQNLTFLIQQ